MKKAASLFLIAPLAACSIGTEVGNGVRPRRDEPGRNSGGPSPKSNPEIAGDIDTATPAGESMNKNKDTSSGSPMGGSLPTSSPAVPISTETWLWRVVTATCASPWAETLRSPVSLRGRVGGSPVALEATLGAEGWLLRLTPGTRTATLRSNSADSPFAVTMTSSEPVTSPPQCSSVNTTTTSTSNGVPLAEHTATVSWDGRSYRLKWTLAGSGNPRSLESIEVTSPAGEVITLKASP